MTSEEMVLSMKESNDSSEKISRLIVAIGEIAFQTNILALNAAVAAACATDIPTLVNEINPGTREQLRGPREQIMQRSAVNAEQSSAASHKLAAQAEGLRSIVEKLRALVGTASETGLSTSHALPPVLRTRSDLSGLVALGKALLHDNAATASELVRSRESFALDEQESALQQNTQKVQNRMLTHAAQ